MQAAAQACTCSCCKSSFLFACAASASFRSWIVFFMCRNLSRVTRPTVWSLKVCSSSCRRSHCHRSALTASQTERTEQIREVTPSNANASQ